MEQMCFDSKIFLHLKPLISHKYVNLPNSFKVRVTKAGSVILNPHITLKNVLFVPSFKYNFISVQRLCQ